MAAPDRRYWFAAKRYGYGWGLPLTWEGWVVLVVFVLVVMAPLTLAGLVGDTTAVVLEVVALVVATPVLVLVCWRTGEPPRWRWGGDR